MRKPRVVAGGGVDTTDCFHDKARLIQFNHVIAALRYH